MKANNYIGADSVDKDDYFTLSGFRVNVTHLGRVLAAKAICGDNSHRSPMFRRWLSYVRNVLKNLNK